MGGDRKGQYAININKQWRVCFEWHDGNAFNAEIIEYDLRVLKRRIWADIEKRIIPVRETDQEVGIGV